MGDDGNSDAWIDSLIGANGNFGLNQSVNAIADRLRQQCPTPTNETHSPSPQVSADVPILVDIIDAAVNAAVGRVTEYFDGKIKQLDDRLMEATAQIGGLRAQIHSLTGKPNEKKKSSILILATGASIADTHTTVVQQLIKQYADGDGKKLDVKFGGYDFRSDAHLVNLAEHLRNPRVFGKMVFKLIFPLEVLQHVNIGNLRNDTISRVGARVGGTKRVFNAEFNSFFKRLLDLCGGSAVSKVSKDAWLHEIREGLMDMGNNIRHGSKVPPMYNLDYIRGFNPDMTPIKHAPAFTDPTPFTIDVKRKRRHESSVEDDEDQG